VLLTGSEDGSAELRALDAGADTFMRKEDDVSVVLARLGALLRHALPPAPTPGTERSTFGPKRILAVDDSVTYLHALADQLRGDGYDVVLAHSGEESLELLGAQPVDCILLDLVMPGLGGCETCRRVKSVPTLRDVPLIMLTSMEDHDSMIDALAAGADDYIQKSTEFEVLAARVRAQLRRKQFEDEHRRIREELLERELRESEARKERALMQEQLMISDRMASVGVLAAGVAHEINNPLGAVLGNLVLAQQAIFGLDVAPAARPRLQEIIEEVRDALEAAQRIRDVAGDLKLFARSDADEQTAVDVQQVIESSIRMARNEIRHRARVSTSFKPVPTVRANASRLGQVFLNLIVNAAQAIPEGRADANEISVRTGVGDDGRVQVEVADTGSGIAPEVLDQLFTPFFTTKPVGVGTGLGLSICNRIVHSFGGTITVESEVGAGSVFCVHLVAASEVDAGTVVGIDREAPAASRRGSVLVIDDEPAIGLLVDRVLSADHDVRSALDANQALGWIEAGERFDVILCDLMMPQVTGMEFY
jgi:signal transduction histidine kinase